MIQKSATLSSAAYCDRRGAAAEGASFRPWPEARRSGACGDDTGVFPSGQRGQTVNLLAMPTVVRIHPPPPEKQVKTPTMPGKLGVTRPERVSQFTLGHPLNFPTFSPKSQTGWTRTLHQHLNIAFQCRIARQIWRRSGLFLPKNRRSENENQ